MLCSQDSKKISNITSTNRALVFMRLSDFTQLDENHIIHKKNLILSTSVKIFQSLKVIFGWFTTNPNLTSITFDCQRYFILLRSTYLLTKTLKPSFKSLNDPDEIAQFA